MNYNVTTSNRFAELNSDDELHNATSGAQKASKKPVQNKQNEWHAREAQPKKKNEMGFSPAPLKKTTRHSQTKPGQMTMAGEDISASKSTDKSNLKRDVDGSNLEQFERYKEVKAKRRVQQKTHVGRETQFSESARPTKRLFDRHSGTGRGKELKRHGGGAHNWGKTVQDARQYQDETQNEEGDENFEGSEDSNADNVVNRQQDSTSNNRADDQHRSNYQRRRDNISSYDQHKSNEKRHDGDADKNSYSKQDRDSDVLDKPRRGQQYDDTRGNFNDNSGRPRAYNTNDMNRQSQRFNGARRGRGGLRRNEKEEEESEEPEKKEPCRPINLDLTDHSAFPTLA